MPTTSTSRTRTRGPALLMALACLALCLSIVADAAAHEVGLSRGDYQIAGATVTAELTFAQRDVVGLAPEVDRSHDDVLSPQEIEQGHDALARVVIRGLVIEGDGRPCPGELVSAQHVEGDGITLRAKYTCAAPAAEVRFDLLLLDDLAYGHRHLFRGGKGSGLTESILYQRRRSIEVLTNPARVNGAGGGAGVPATASPDGNATPPDATPGSAAPAARHNATGAFELFRMGIEHILGGYDHLVFLLGLVLVGGRRRELFLVITAFTLAHSITLGLAVLGVWTPSPRFIEPAIALSIAYVGVENFFVRDAAKRWRITFPFGLVHGFGFAGALQEIALPRADIPLALLSFNLGVEAGQLAVLLVLLPLLSLARRRPSFQAWGMKAVSGLIVLAGLGWFVTRVAGL